MKKVISMNLINVIQMKTQSFWLTALLVLLGVFSTVNTNAAEKLMAGTGKVNIIPAIRFTIHSMHELLFLKRELRVLLLSLWIWLCTVMFR